MQKSEPLKAHLFETLKMLRNPKTAGELHALDTAVSPNAFSNRLSELLKAGLVTRRREGKFWRYSRK